jgi:UDP-glucose:(heptosyl)LPS alpha-1,3-glucosyltransferase
VIEVRIAIAVSKLDALHGGAESWTLQLATWLSKRRHEIHLVASTASEEVLRDFDRVHLLPPTHDRVRVANHLSRWLAQNQFDLVHDTGVGIEFDIFQPHFGSWHAMELGKLKSLLPRQRWTRRLVRTFSHRKKAIESLAKIQFSNRTATYIAVSDMVARDLHHFESIPNERIQTIPNGIDTSKFHPEKRRDLRNAARYQLGIQPDDLVVSLVAHNHQLKGVPNAIQALKQAHEFPVSIHMLIAGGHRQGYQQIDVGRHRLTFVGSVVDILPVLAASDIYLHPTFYDACCLAVLEAMACGIPTITTQNNGAAQFIEHGKNGLLMENAADLESMLQHLKTLVAIETRKSIGHAAAMTMRKWTQDDNFYAVETLYQDHLASKTSSDLQKQCPVRLLAASA